MITIKDVAVKAGVSVTTVSRVLNRKGPLSDATIKAVHEAMKDLDYQPNNLARSLVKGKYNCIGVVFPSLNNPFWSELAHEIEFEAKKKGYRLMVCVSYFSEEREKQSLQLLRGNMSDGIILAGRISENTLKDSKIPIVLIENEDDRVPSIMSDDYQGGVLATRHLISKGCKNLVHISGVLNVNKHNDARSDAFVKECQTRSIPFKVYQASDDNIRNMDYEGLIGNVFFENPDADGIFASNDIIGAQCIKTAMSLGYHIPGDIKIIGFDDILLSRLLYPELTTIRQDLKQIAKSVISTLIDMIDGKNVEMKEVIPVRLIERKTT